MDEFDSSARKEEAWNAPLDYLSEEEGDEAEVGVT